MEKGRKKECGRERSFLFLYFIFQNITLREALKKKV